MSWQSYIDEHLLGTGNVTHAVITGHDGNIWATSKDFNITPEECKIGAGKFNDEDSLQSSGITIGGIKYLFTSSVMDQTLKVIRCRKESNGVIAIKTSQTCIFTVYCEPQQAGQASHVTCKLGDYLIENGF